MKCLVRLSTSLLKHLNSSDKEKETVLVFALTTLAFSHHNNTTSGDIKKQCHSIVQDFLKQWISKPSVIGGSIFGGSVQDQHVNLTQQEAEIKVFFLQLKQNTRLIVILHVDMGVYTKAHSSRRLSTTSITHRG